MKSADDVRRKLEAVCREAGSQLAWARANDISQAYVNDVLHGRREPGDSILRALGLRRVVSYDIERDGQ